MHEKRSAKASKRFRDILIGPALPTTAASGEKLSIPIGLAVISSDVLSSCAYAADELLAVLVAADMRHHNCAARCIGDIVPSVDSRLPLGGGAYTVAKENLDETTLHPNSAYGIIWMTLSYSSIIILRHWDQVRCYPEKRMTVTFKAGDTVGGYKIIESVGEGGLSQLFKATAPDGKVVKLKFPAAALIGDPAIYERFLREFTIGQKLTHPAIQRTIAMEESPESIFLVLDFIEGKSLRTYIMEHAPLVVDEAIDITVQLAEALEYLHRNGVFHRDLKPENIVLDPDKKIHIVDFGVALLEGARRVTWRFGSNVFGTPDYMSPEQIQGKRGDARTDIYALGIIFYELLTGNIPFRGDNPLSVMSQHLTGIPEPPRKLNPAIPLGVEAIILKAIRRDPSNRYQSAETMLQDLQHYKELDLSRFDLEPEKSIRSSALTDRQVWILSAVIAASFLVIAALIVFIFFLVKHH